MPYVYRYIDLSKEEVCYIGKVTTHDDESYGGIEIRNEQHRREKWYKDIGEDNLLLQFIKLDSHTDADILETWLIQYYDNGQLVNKAKTNWGRSSLPLYDMIFGRWRNFRGNKYENEKIVEREFRIMWFQFMAETNGLKFDATNALDALGKRIKELQSDMVKSEKFSSYDMQQSEFLRKS